MMPIGTPMWSTKARSCFTLPLLMTSALGVVQDLESRIDSTALHQRIWSTGLTKEDTVDSTVLIHARLGMLKTGPNVQSTNIQPKLTHGIPVDLVDSPPLIVSSKNLYLISLQQARSNRTHL